MLRWTFRACWPAHGHLGRKSASHGMARIIRKSGHSLITAECRHEAVWFGGNDGPYWASVVFARCRPKATQCTSHYPLVNVRSLVPCAKVATAIRSGLKAPSCCSSSHRGQSGCECVFGMHAGWPRQVDKSSGSSCQPLHVAAHAAAIAKLKIHRCTDSNTERKPKGGLLSVVVPAYGRTKQAPISTSPTSAIILIPEELRK